MRHSRSNVAEYFRDLLALPFQCKYSAPKLKTLLEIESLEDLQKGIGVYVSSDFIAGVWALSCRSLKAALDHYYCKLTSPEYLS